MKTKLNGNFKKSPSWAIHIAKILAKTIYSALYIGLYSFKKHQLRSLFVAKDIYLYYFFMKNHTVYGFVTLVKEDTKRHFKGVIFHSKACTAILFRHKSD